MHVLNILLYLAFLFNQDVYHQLRQQGATCYGYVAHLGDEDPDAPPPCPYKESE
jgi:hypothetical protein